MLRRISTPRQAVLTGCLALLFSRPLEGQAPPATRASAGVTVLFTLPTRVGLQWSRNISFDLTTGLQTGSCGSYPPTPTAPFPCYWGDENGPGPVNVSLFANVAGPGSVVSSTLLGQAGNFGGSNTSVASVFYGPGNLAPCLAGDSTAACVGRGFRQISSVAATPFASAAAPTTGWTQTPNGIRFLFQVPANLSATGGAAGRATTLSVTLP